VHLREPSATRAKDAALGSRKHESLWREAPLTEPKYAGTTRFSRHGHEGISYRFDGT
jgi:hypothetical protein